MHIHQHLRLPSRMNRLHTLPEELLDLILREALVLPSSVFLRSSEGRAQRPRPPPVRASDVLLVCKAWARVGRRHLYEGIILRRKRQAKALTNTLLADRRRTHRSRTTLGEHIRRLRIENVQCRAVVDVLRLATNMEDLYISLAVPPFARPVNWLAGFRCVSPRRLYLQDTQVAYANNDRLLNAIEDALTTTPDKRACWNTLEEVHMRSMDFSIMPGLGSALSVLPRLRLITASDVWYAQWWKAFIPIVANNERLQAVLLDCGPGLFESSVLQGRAEEITRFECYDLKMDAVRKFEPGAVRVNRTSAITSE
ncbi:hypothetical protein FKP32DRAFT_1000016 [Trametes sanguinea]|nr:hypothetical protein FKP32DRAFT_1000016 [Trametes sanguinea]